LAAYQMDALLQNKRAHNSPVSDFEVSDIAGSAGDAGRQAEWSVDRAAQRQMLEDNCATVSP